MNLFKRRRHTKAALNLEIARLKNFIEGQNTTISELHDEIDRLKSIDAAVRDHNGAIAKAVREEFQREGFKEAVASRPFVRRKL